MSEYPTDLKYSKDHEWAKVSGNQATVGRAMEEKLEPVPGQTVLEHGPDRNLSVDEIGGIRLMENESPARVRG